MTTHSPAMPNSQDLLDLVRRCASLCESAEHSIQQLNPDPEGFLTKNLVAAIQQVELVLRVMGETSDSSRASERQSLFSRLFAKIGREGSPDDPNGDASPDLQVPSQGLQGTSWTVTLAELLGFLAFAGKTGVLWVDSPRENFLVGIVDGNLMHASSDHTPEGLRLGEVLVGLGFLTRPQLERFLQDRPEGEMVSGEVLLESSMISGDELRVALTYQVRELFARLVTTEQAVFRFQDRLNVQLAYQVDLNINQLLLDSARSNDECENASHEAASAIHEWHAWRQDFDDDAPTELDDVPSLSVDEDSTNDASDEADQDPAERGEDGSSKPANAS